MVVAEDVFEAAAECLPLADRCGVVGLESVLLGDVSAINLSVIYRRAGHLVVDGLRERPFGIA